MIVEIKVKVVVVVDVVVVIPQENQYTHTFQSKTHQSWNKTRAKQNPSSLQERLNLRTKTGGGRGRVIGGATRRADPQDAR